MRRTDRQRDATLYTASGRAAEKYVEMHVYFCKLLASILYPSDCVNSQGVMNIYRFPAASSEQVVSATDDLASSFSGLFRGLPSNEPVHVLVRIYVVKVRHVT